MKTTEQLENKLNKLQQRNNLFTFLIILCLGYFAYQEFQKSDVDVITTKGIVIVDEEGRDRILIGAPVPTSKDRIRDNYEKAMEAWQDDFGEGYAEWYKGYSHENFGMLILDENGFDRLALGSPTPDPNIGKRLGPATGLEINDERGFEWSGYGLLKVNGNNRVVLGLDNDNGTEGLSLILSDEGNTGLFMKSSEGSIFLGKAKDKNYYADTFPFQGIFMQSDSIKKEFQFNLLEK